MMEELIGMLRRIIVMGFDFLGPLCTVLSVWEFLSLFMPNQDEETPEKQGHQRKNPTKLIIVVAITCVLTWIYTTSAEVPNVKELNLNSARQTLKEKGFEVFVNGENLQDQNLLVQEQSPQEGTITEKGARVELWLKSEETASASIKIPPSTTTPAPAETLVKLPMRIIPSDYSTQFQNTSKGMRCDPSRLRTLFDGDWKTNYYWVIWRSEYTDDIPEFTFSFSGEDIDGIKIRNGNLIDEQKYYQSARLGTISLDIISNGHKYMESIVLQDVYMQDYQQFRFSRSYSNVTEIRMWYQSAYKGDTDVNDCYISDIEFFQ